MSSKPEEDQSEESTLEDGGGPEESCSSGKNSTGAACADLSCSDQLDFIAKDNEKAEKIDPKPVTRLTRGRATAKTETSPKPAVKRRRISLDDSKLRKQPGRNKKQSLDTKQK